MAKETTNKATPAFIKLVEQMRAAQKAYFKNREKAALIISKDLEAKVDNFILNQRHPPLFPP